MFQKPLSRETRPTSPPAALRPEAELLRDRFPCSGDNEPSTVFDGGDLLHLSSWCHCNRSISESFRFHAPSGDSSGHEMRRPPRRAHGDLVQGIATITARVVTGQASRIPLSPSREPARMSGTSCAEKPVTAMASSEVIIVSRIPCQSRLSLLTLERLPDRRLQFEIEQRASHHCGRNDHEVDYRDRCSREVAQSEAH